MESYTLPERLHPYFPKGFISEDFGAGKRISTLTGCDLYIYKRDLEVRAAILCGVLFPADCQEITRGINIVRAAERVVTAAIEAGMSEQIKAVTVETLLEKAWSDGGIAFKQFYEEIGRPAMLCEYLGIHTGYGQDDVSAAIVIDQEKKPLNAFLEKYVQILVGAARKSSACNEGIVGQNYRLELGEMVSLIEAEMGIVIQKDNFPMQIKGYNEQLILAGLFRVSDFDAISKILASASSNTIASSDKRQVS